MRYYSRKGVYAAGPNCTYNPETREAHSYGWWRFVSFQHGQLIFNDYQYSNTTRGHQSKVRRLLGELGLTIDVVVYSRAPIPTLQTKTELKKYIKACETARLKEIEDKRLERNRKARERRTFKKLQAQTKDKNSNQKSIEALGVLRLVVSNG